MSLLISFIDVYNDCIYFSNEFLSRKGLWNCYTPKLKILLITLLILGSLAVGLYAVVIFWPVADAEKSDLIICLVDMPGQGKSLA